MEFSLAELAQTLAAVEAQSPKSTLEIFGPRPEHEQFFHDLCQAYLDLPADKRFQFHDLVADKEGIQNCLLGYGYMCARELQATRDEHWLRLGVAASTLASRRMDYRDVLLNQAELYVVAEEAGTDPNPAFAEVASLPEFGTYAVVRSRRSGTHRMTPPAPPRAENRDKPA